MKTSAINSSFSFTLKGVFCLLILCVCYFGSAQTSVMVNYKTSTAAIPNPERGFYKHHEVHSSSYSGLSQTTLNGYRANNITLVLRLFYLEGFLNGPISSAYLANVQADFNKIRSAGLKCIVRFAYSDNTNGTLDAPKSVVLNHIAQLKPLFVNNSDIIAAVQAGFIGSWGEWYYTSNFGLPPSSADYANRKEVVDAILAAIPDRMVQIRTPSLKQKTYNTTAALNADQAFKGTNISRVGHHNDCFLASSNDFGTYNNTSAEYPYLEQETVYTAMGGETCAVNEPRSKCTTAILEMAKFHYSYLNIDYNGSVIGGFQSESCFSQLQNNLGYRFELVNGLFPKSPMTETTFPITLNIKNSGFSALYNQRTAYIVFRNSSTGKEFPIALKADPRFWTGGTQQTITENLTLPSDIVDGDYKLYLSFPDSNSELKIRPEYSIRLANDNQWESNTGYNNLLYTVTLQPGLSTNNNERKLNLVIYAIPGADEMVVEMEGIKDYRVSVFNTLGQKINVDSYVSANRLILNTQSLNTGVYFLQFQNDKIKETRKIIVNH